MRPFDLSLPIHVVSEANERGDWRAGHKRTTEQRGLVRLALRTIPRPPSTLPLVITLERVAPLPLDDDNFARGLKAVRDEVAETLAGRRAPVPTGFAALDGDEHGLGHFAGGLHRGELVVVTADQGGGKTAWVLQIALHAARQGRSVLVISQEMSAEALYWRLACADAKVDSGLLRSGRLSQDDITALQAASRAYVNLDLRVVDCGCNVDDIRTAALSVAATGPLHLVVVDYLQILDAPEDAPDKAHEVVDANALAMKKLARELDAPVVLLSQFNRSAQTTPRKPRIQDLKGSGGIESHADVIVALWPEGGRRDGPMPAELPVEGLILKNRNGPTEAFPMVFERALTRFREDVKRTEGAVPPSYPDDLPEGMPAAAPAGECAP